MSEPVAVYRTHADCLDWDEGEDLRAYAAELRAARGEIPTQRQEPARRWHDALLRHAPRDAVLRNPPWSDDPEPHADWPVADRRALAELQAAVRDVLIDYHDGDDLDWIVEETLWQIRMRLKRQGIVRLPMTATMAVGVDGRLYGAGVDGFSRDVRS